MKPSAANRLRILAVATRPPWWRDRGISICMDRVFSNLANRADITVALPANMCVDSPPDDRIRVEAMTGFVSADGEQPDDGLSWVSRLTRKHIGYDPAIGNWLKSNAHPGRFDVAMFFTAKFGQYVTDCNIPGIWNICDDMVLYMLRDMESSPWHRWPKSAKELLFLLIYERFITRRMATTLFVSDIDASYAKRWLGDVPMTVIQNGVDFEYFKPSNQPPTPGTIAFVGAFDFAPNIDGAIYFSKRVWPKLYAEDPTRRLLLVGRDPVNEVKSLGSLPGITLSANVPDVRPYLHESVATIVPTRKGGGIKNKVLEAAAIRKPVVATSRALAGLNARIGVDVLRADTPAQWVKTLGRLLTCPRYAETIAQNGHEWVRNNHGVEKASSKYYDMFLAAAKPHSSLTNVRTPRDTSLTTNAAVSEHSPQDLADDCKSTEKTQKSVICFEKELPCSQDNRRTQCR